MRAISAVVAAHILAGCATTSQVADTAVKTNLVQEQAHNQLLLLNVLRAYERRPMHFTQISAVRLPPGFGNPTFGLPIQFGGDRTNLYTLATTLGIQQSVDTTPLNTQEFMRGVTTPLPPSLMLYFLDQGWPQQLILHMFVREMEFFDGSKKLIDRVTNYPENKKEFDRFQAAVDQLRTCDFESSPELVSQTFFTPILTDADWKNFKDVAAAKAAGLVPVKVNSSGEPATKGQTVVGVRFASTTKAVGIDLTDRLGGEKCGIRAPSKGPSFNRLRVSADDDKSSSEMTVRLVLRSPEAMLYYLGEIGRAQLHGQMVEGANDRVLPKGIFPAIGFRQPRAEDSSDRNVTLFRLQAGTADPRDKLTVSYEGSTYSVSSSSDEDRSMHVLSLVSQILALQNKSNDLPTTANVRVVP
jgi:hypothetical protein